MRFVPYDLEQKLKNHKQTLHNNNAPELNMWIFRHTLPLTKDRFLERQTLDITGASAIDVAVRHPIEGRESDRIYVAYVKYGTAKCISSPYKLRMKDHSWSEESFEQSDVDDIAIAFSGSMPKRSTGEVEFVTEDKPWLFWVTNGRCYGNQLYSNSEPQLLVEDNCTKVDAIRAVTTDYGAFDFGMCVFFIVNGQLFYRQLINGVWYDAEYVSAFSDLTLTDVSVTRTWDYRLIVQVKANNGNIYEIISKYEGVGKQNLEKIEAIITVHENLINLNTYGRTVVEHLNAIYNVNSELFVTGEVVILSAQNEEVFGNYGKKIVITVNKDLMASSMSGSRLEWYLTDSEGTVYHPSFVELGSDLRTITLTFSNFNKAVGECSISYSGSTVKFPANIPIETLDPFYFTPIGLDPDSYPPPSIMDYPNSYIANPLGTIVILKFTQPLDKTDIAENINNFSVLCNEPDWMVTPPDRTVELRPRAIQDFYISQDGTEITLTFKEGNATSLVNGWSRGCSNIIYRDGTLHNSNGDVENFGITIFMSDDAVNDWVPVRGRQRAESLYERTTINANLISIRYHNPESVDHIDVAVSINETLTNIDDL